MTLWWGLALAAAAAAFVAWPLVARPPREHDVPHEVPDAAAELERELAWDAAAGRLDPADLPAAGAPPGENAEPR